MDIKLINVGYGNFISSSRIIAIIGPESAPVKRMIQEAREERRLIDATYGRSCLLYTSSRAQRARVWNSGTAM